MSESEDENNPQDFDSVYEEARQKAQMSDDNKTSDIQQNQHHHHNQPYQQHPYQQQPHYQQQYANQDQHQNHGEHYQVVQQLEGGREVEPQVGIGIQEQQTARGATMGAETTNIIIKMPSPALDRKLPSPLHTSTEMQRAVNSLKLYYKSNFNFSPLGFVAESLDLEKNMADLVIREISIGGQENRATNETSYKTLFTRPERMLRILMEGSPGYGKTTLAKRIAYDWGKDAPFMKHFGIVIFVPCLSLNGRDIDEWLYEDHRIELHHWKNDSKKILFILDGLNECNEEDINSVKKILKGKHYTEASVLATSRYLDPLTNSAHQILREFRTRVELSGFNRDGVEKLIDNYFQSPEKGDKLKELIFSGNQGYENLVCCPLFSYLFCILYEDSQQMPEKTTEVYMKIIICLMNRENSRTGKNLFPQEPLEVPDHIVHMLNKFGKLCIMALQDRHFRYFQKKDLESIFNEVPQVCGGQSDVIMGFLVKTRSRADGFSKLNEIRFQPIHKSFLEFVSAFFLHRLVKDAKIETMVTEMSNLQKGMESSSVIQILLYTVELLREDAWQILSRVKSSGIQLGDSEYFRLLTSAGCSDNNVKAVKSVMKLETVTIECSSVKKMDTWSDFISRLDVVQELNFSWDQNKISLQEEAVMTFFRTLKTNNSIKAVNLHLFHGRMLNNSHPDYQSFKQSFIKEIEAFCACLKNVIMKPNLRTLSIKIEVIQTDRVVQVDFASPIVDTFVKHSKKSVLSNLKQLTLNMDLNSSLITKLMKSLRDDSNLELKLHLPRLNCGPQGFTEIAATLMTHRIQHLEVQLNPYRYLELGEQEVVNKEPVTSVLRGEGLGRGAFLKTMSPEEDESSSDFQNMSLDNQTSSSPRLIHISEGSRRSLSQSDPLLSRLSSTELLPDVKEWTREVKQYSTSAQCAQLDGWKDVIPQVTSVGCAPISGVHLGTNIYTDTDTEAFASSQTEINGETQHFYHVRFSDFVCPLPVCAGHQDTQTGFHILFQALANPECKLKTFYLHHCIILKQAEYFSCLGEAIGKNKSLETLKVDNVFSEKDEPDVKYILPLILALRSNTSLVNLDLSSAKLILNSEAVLIFLDSLEKNKTLQSLDISGWKFYLDLRNSIHVKDLIGSLKNMMKASSLRTVSLAKCAVHVRVANSAPNTLANIHTNIQQHNLVNNSVETLQVLEVDVFIDNGQQDGGAKKYKIRDFMSLITFKQLSWLNIAETLVRDSSIPVDDDSLCKFFESLNTKFPKIERLHLGNWIFNTKDPDMTKKKLKVALPGLTKLKRLNLDIVNNMRDDRGPGSVSQSYIIKLLLTKIPNLNQVGSLMGKIPDEEMDTFCKCLRDIGVSRMFKVETLFISSHVRDLMKRLESYRRMNTKYNAVTGEIELSPRPGRLNNFSKKVNLKNLLDN